ncbi:hypothetical protein RCL_jg2768.t1 [Rhizophagus clarus]|uniref:Uncharacterized protein n=1 Tax=Rhizophagus clarus TaxID=94130 RepID=A0A8H3M317_9GLOM|nr:hypothetical protein RCL_jg2768.t1 [Rhizophagus clarus]
MMCKAHADVPIDLTVFIDNRDIASRLKSVNNDKKDNKRSLEEDSNGLEQDDFSTPQQSHMSSLKENLEVLDPMNNLIDQVNSKRYKNNEEKYFREIYEVLAKKEIEKKI